jgi:hypothetical protein
MNMGCLSIFCISLSYFINILWFFIVRIITSFVNLVLGVFFCSYCEWNFAFLISFSTTLLLYVKSYWFFECWFSIMKPYSIKFINCNHFYGVGSLAFHYKNMSVNKTCLQIIWFSHFLFRYHLFLFLAS